MIIISQPKLEVRENEVLVSSCIEDDKKHFRETIFYKTSATYRPYVVTEKADLFVLSALMPALFSQSDIRVEGTLSSDLKYALENGLIYILAKTYGACFFSVAILKFFEFSAFLYSFIACAFASLARFLGCLLYTSVVFAIVLSLTSGASGFLRACTLRIASLPLMSG